MEKNTTQGMSCMDNHVVIMLHIRGMGMNQGILLYIQIKERLLELYRVL